MKGVAAVSSGLALIAHSGTAENEHKRGQLPVTCFLAKSHMYYKTSRVIGDRMSHPIMHSRQQCTNHDHTLHQYRNARRRLPLEGSTCVAPTALPRLPPASAPKADSKIPGQLTCG